MAVPAASTTPATLDTEEVGLEAQIYPDTHAEVLAKLKSCSWHVPERTVMQLIGFDTVKKLRRGGALQPALTLEGQPERI